MKIAAGAFIALFVAWAAFASARAAEDKIPVVAAENFYGNLARQIGGDRVSVISILRNPQQDPHLFETSPSVVRALAGAQIVLYNGAGYDQWMDNLLKVTPKAGRVVIVAAQIVGAKPGANPHLWYDPRTMPAVAAALTAKLSAVDPAHAAGYAVRSQDFLASLAPLTAKITSLRAAYAGVPVTATEPIFGDMAAALHLTMRNQPFQLAVMNNTEPSAADVAAFERSLTMHSVRLLFYNKQASDNLVRHLVDLARASKIPVVGVTETCPPDLSYQDWMLDELGQTETALAGPAS
ncbi:MAG TPA: zinc ABC transporter substrate-binding protein [Xanthobacteraceae bacterium]|jgi:zinc/manganese transport system substrate-binding protein|nr:zinc ABC transporter substrate-binding protein [Xanthobacteraceae bacterium]